MKIETKYNIGDSVWWGNEGFIGNGVVDKVVAIIGDNAVINYNVALSGELPLVFSLSEKDLFPTKEDLLKSLKRNKDND